MKTKLLSKSNYFYSLLIFSIQLYSCCILQSTSPEIKITDQDFPATATVNKEFYLSFTIGNHSEAFFASDCESDESPVGSVNLKMVNRETGHEQVNNTGTLKSLDYNTSEEFIFKVIIGPEGAGTYDMTFIVHNTYISDNTVTGVIIVN